MSASDRYGLPLTTASATAVEAYGEGVDLLLAVQPGAEAAFERAIAADPGFALAHVARARVQQLRMDPAAARTSAAQARGLLGGVTTRERGHVETIARAVEGDAAGARRAVDEHCAAFPRDALVLQLNFGAFGLISFAGGRDHDDEMLELFRRYVGHYGDDWWFRFAWGWAHTEAGHVREGRRLMEEAFTLHPRNANAVHGLAHVYYEEGDPAGGVAFVSKWLPEYDPAASLHCHLTWHVALAELVQGDVARARAAYEAGIRAKVAPLAPATNVLTDGASLLWRFMLDEQPVAASEWAEVAEHARRSFPSTAPHFHELHALMAWAAAGEWTLYEERLGELRARAAKGALPPGDVVPALGEGFGAFVRGDYAAAARAIEPYVDDIVRCGGSHAQQDVWEETLVAAWLRTGEADKAARLLEQRLARRPSPRAAAWLSRARAA
ncbi:MAG: tetratricopeptide repeat protein [Candidatus Rokubacteria bacterium]|nr:tetratricopeptide repeat protein [Candidatus Rokubacteria bacterium]